MSFVDLHGPNVSVCRHFLAKDLWAGDAGLLLAHISPLCVFGSSKSRSHAVSCEFRTAEPLQHLLLRGAFRDALVDVCQLGSNSNLLPSMVDS